MNAKRKKLINRYQNSPGDLLAAVDGLSERDLDRRLAAGKWNIRQQVHHIADAEAVAVYRMKKIIAEDRPIIMAFDQDRWSQKFKYEDSAVENSIALFFTLRASMTPLLKRLTDSDFSRTGVHSERGLISVEDLLADAIEHTEHHLKEIESVKKKYKIE